MPLKLLIFIQESNKLRLWKTQLKSGRGQALSVLLRDKQIEYSHLVTASSHGAHYRPFKELTRAALVYALKK